MSSESPLTESLGPDQRIRKRSLFQTLFRKGRFFKGKFLRLWVCEDPEARKNPEAKPQMGVIVSRKVHSRAVKRNLWKRRIRESFRRNQAQIKNNTAVLIQASKASPIRRGQTRGSDPLCQNSQEIPSYKMIESDLFELLEKAGCLIKQIL